MGNPASISSMAGRAGHGPNAYESATLAKARRRPPEIARRRGVACRLLRGSDRLRLTTIVRVEVALDHRCPGQACLVARRRERSLRFPHTLPQIWSLDDPQRITSPEHPQGRMGGHRRKAGLRGLGGGSFADVDRVLEPLDVEHGFREEPASPRLIGGRRQELAAHDRGGSRPLRGPGGRAARSPLVRRSCPARSPRSATSGPESPSSRR